MKKIIIILLALLSFVSYGQAEYEKIAITENVETASTSKIVSQQPGTGELNYINATALPISTAATSALGVKTENSAGAIQGFAITNNGNGTVNIATGTAYLRATNDPYAPLVEYTIPAVTNLALTDNANNFVLVDYNGGSPALTVTIAPGTINTTTNSIAYLIARVGTTLDYINLVGQNVDANGKLRRRFLNSESLRRASGAVLTASNRNLLLTAGLFYSGLIEATTPAFNTSTGSTFTQAYLSGSTWVRTTGNTQINNTQYSLSGVLTAMPSNDYRVDYVYALADNPSKLYVLLGTTTYNNITNARLAPVPVDLPTELQYLGARVGRVIIQKDATVTETTSEFATIYQAGTAQLHNDLGGLNLGDFQHLTVAEKANLELKTNKSDSYTASSSITYASTAALVGGLGVVQKDVAYVDVNGNNATAILGNIRKPFLTIDAALDALPATGGQIKIGVGTFSSPDITKIKNNTKFIGSGKPYPNMVFTYVDEFTQPTITPPTKLVGGTILTNSFLFSHKNNIELYNLGVDVGKEWIDANNGGVAKEGILTGSLTALPNNTIPPTTGIIIDNVSSLNYSSNDAVHAMAIENTINARLSNISTYYGFHGLTIKSEGVNIDNIESYGHGGEGVIIKSDSYAYNSDTNINNVFISSIVGYDGGGFMIDGGTGNLQRINISNVNIRFTKYGIENTASGTIESVNIDNVNVYRPQNTGLSLNEFVNNAKINNVQVYESGSYGVILQLNSGAFSISNSGSLDSSVEGFFLNGYGSGKILANNLTSEGSGASGFNLQNSVYGSGLYSDTGITGTLIFLPSTSHTIAGIGANGNVTKTSVTETPTEISSQKTLKLSTGNDEGLYIENTTTTPSATGGKFRFNIFSDLGFIFQEWNNSNAFQRNIMTFEKNTGRVGIGTTTPTEALDVVGIVKATSFNGSATLTGTPTAPTATVGSNTAQIATTAFVQAANGTFVADAITDGVTTIAPSQNAVFDVLALKAGLGYNLYTNTQEVLGGDFKTNGTVHLLSGDTGFDAPGYSAHFHIRNPGFWESNVQLNATSFVATSGAIRLKNYTVATLPAGTQGDMAFVTDATAPTYLGTLTGGGSVVCPVFYNGTAWVSH